MFKRVSYSTMFFAASVAPAFAGGGTESAPTAFIVHMVGKALAQLLGLL